MQEENMGMGGEMAQQSPEMGMNDDLSPDEAMASLALATNFQEQMLAEDSLLEPDIEDTEPVEFEDEEVIEEEDEGGDIEQIVEDKVKSAIKEEMKGLREEIKKLVDEDE